MKKQEIQNNRTTRAASVNVSELPELLNVDRLDCDVVGSGTNLYRLPAEKGTKRLDKYNASPEEMLAEYLEAGVGIDIAKDDATGKVVISNTGETGAGGNPDTRKYYILPLAGQSNMTGFGEVHPYPSEPNPRLMQLGFQTGIPDPIKHPGQSEAQANRQNITLEMSGHKDLATYKKYRPYEVCNLRVIPAAPCLDVCNNLYHVVYYTPVAGSEDEPIERRKGGLVGAGYYLAQQLLNYIPEDYGILIVNASRGSLGFGDENPIGDGYDAAKMWPAINGNRLGVNQPYGRLLIDRVRHALQQNAANRLLPVIWFQGESDAQPQIHYDRFKAYLKQFRQFIQDEFEDRLPTGHISDFRWFSFGSTKMLLEVDGDLSYYNKKINHRSDWSYLRGCYDNYAYLSEDPEFVSKITGESQLVPVRCDLSSRGRFYETVREAMLERGWKSVASTAPEWHWSAAHVMFEQPGEIINALSMYGKCLNGGPRPVDNTRYNRAKTALLVTDGTTFEYDLSATANFDAKKGLLLHHDFTKDTLQAPTFKANGVTVAITGTPIIEGTRSSSGRSDGRCLVFKSKDYANVAGLKYTFPTSTDSAFTLMFDFKPSVALREKGYDTGPMFSAGAVGKNNFPVICHHESATMIESNFTYNLDSTKTENLSLNKFYLGAWKGQFEDWQRLILAYDPSSQYMHVFLNGCLVDSIKRSVPLSPEIWERMDLGSYKGKDSGWPYDLYQGKIRTFRVYNRTLTKGQCIALSQGYDKPVTA